MKTEEVWIFLGRLTLDLIREMKVVLGTYYERGGERTPHMALKNLPYDSEHYPGNMSTCILSLLDRWIERKTMPSTPLAVAAVYAAGESRDAEGDFADQFKWKGPCPEPSWSSY